MARYLRPGQELRAGFDKQSYTVAPQGSSKGDDRASTCSLVGPDGVLSWDVWRAFAWPDGSRVVRGYPPKKKRRE